MVTDLAPRSVEGVLRLFEGAPFRWWVAGGHALELHLSESWRSHSDIDVGVCRSEASLLYQWLGGWDLNVASLGILSSWDGRPLRSQDHENNIWVRTSPSQPWAFDVNLGGGTGQRWEYRRDRRVHRPWDEAILTSSEGAPYLAPDLQLLFKSSSHRPKDDLDAETVIPRLGADEKQFLRDHVEPGHDWHQLLGSNSSTK